MGVTIRQKKRGKGQPWWVFITHNSNRTSRLVGDKRAAEVVASKIRAKLQLGEFGFEQKTIPAFKDYSQIFLNGYSKSNHKESTQDSYKDVLRIHILPVFGNNPLNEITRKDIKEFIYRKQGEGLSQSTVRIIKSYLSSILSQAVDDEIIQVNPAHSLGKVIKKKDQGENINPLSKEELKSLLDSVKIHFSGHYTLFLLLPRTGVRIGEALALQWGDIDFAGRFIEVKRSIVRGRISMPKNNKSRRVDMSLQLTEALKAYRVESKKKGFSLGLGDETEYIFTNEAGKPVDVNNWRRRVFNKALEKAGVRRIRIHDLRHTYATLRISKGDNIGDVANQLGHHSVKLTLDTYYHWMPGKKKSEVDALDDSFIMHPSAPYMHPGTFDKQKKLAKNQLTY